MSLEEQLEELSLCAFRFLVKERGKDYARSVALSVFDTAEYLSDGDFASVHKLISPLLDDQDGVKMSEEYLEEWPSGIRWLVFGELVCLVLQLFSPFDAEISVFAEDKEVQVNGEDNNGDDVCFMISEDGIILSSSLVKGFQHFPWTSKCEPIPESLNIDDNGRCLMSLGVGFITHSSIQVE